MMIRRCTTQSGNQTNRWWWSGHVQHRAWRLDSQMVMRAMKKTWIPAPTNAVSSSVWRGGRNTSPCTSFHPVSSTVSSYQTHTHTITIHCLILTHTHTISSQCLILTHTHIITIHCLILTHTHTISIHCLILTHTHYYHPLSLPNTHTHYYYTLSHPNTLLLDTVSS